VNPVLACIAFAERPVVPARPIIIRSAATFFRGVKGGQIFGNTFMALSDASRRQADDAAARDGDLRRITANDEPLTRDRDSGRFQPKLHEPAASGAISPSAFKCAGVQVFRRPKMHLERAAGYAAALALEDLDLRVDGLRRLERVRFDERHSACDRFVIDAGEIHRDPLPGVSRISRTPVCLHATDPDGRP
jgi:hypothetical protein